MILKATNNFSTPTPTLTAENYHIWAIKMKAYLKRSGYQNEGISKRSEFVGGY